MKREFDSPLPPLTKEENEMKTEKQKLIGKINLIGITLGMLIILLGLSSFLEIGLKYIIFFLIFVDIILLIWRFLLEGRK